MDKFEAGDPVDVIGGPYNGWSGEIVESEDDIGEDGWVIVDFDGNYIETPTKYLERAQ